MKRHLFISILSMALGCHVFASAEANQTKALRLQVKDRSIDQTRVKPGVGFTPKKAKKIRAQLTSPEFQEKLKEIQSARGVQEALDPTPFQGWWQLITRGNLNGFAETHFGTATSDSDSYIFIDTETLQRFGITIVSTLAGTPVYPREFTNQDYGTTQEPLGLNFYYQASPTEIVQVFDLDGPAFDPTVGQSSWSLKLQADGQSLCAGFDSRPDFVGTLTDSGFYQKISAPPPIRPFDATDSAFPDVTNPVAMAQYIYNAFTLNFLDPQNIHFDDQDYKSFYEREAIFAQLLDEGFTFITPIRRIRVSQPGTHYLAAYSQLNAPNGTFISHDLVTDIFTDGFSFATTGSTVEIGGFEGPWARMNGIYVNGVATQEANAIPNPRPPFVDVNEEETKGTFLNVYNHFQLRFDSQNAKKFPRDELGYGTEICGKPYVKVHHSIKADTEYPAFIAGLQMMFYKMYQVSFHTMRFGGRFKLGSMFLFNTFEEMKTHVASGDFWGNPLNDNGFNGIQSRINQAIPSGFFNNPIYNRRGVTTYNDPFGLSQAPGSYNDYNIVMANYLDQKSIKNLYWAISGHPATLPDSPKAPDGAFLQFDPREVGYKPAIPVPGSTTAEFVGALGDVTVVKGKPQPQFPSVDPTGKYYSLLGDFFTPFGDDTSISNAYYVGLIDSRLTNGKKVGYLRWLDEGLIDPGFFLPTATFPPVAASLPPSQGGTNLKYGREAMSQVFSIYTRYFNELGCDALILDIRSNNGGQPENIVALAEFVGDDRALFSQRWSKKDNGNSDLIDLADTSQYTFFQEIQERNSASFAQLFVQQNAATYGADTIFRGSPGHPKKIIVLTDYGAASAGDAFPHLFLGEFLDGNLGSNTTGIIIGDIDGRLKGSSSNASPVPVSKFANQLYDQLGRPFAPIKYTADLPVGQVYNGLTGIPYNIQSELVAPVKAPSLKGTAGGNPLPNDWETNVWPALGLIKAPKGLFDPRFPKGKPNFKNRESWRDPWLEQAILAAIGAESDALSSSSCHKQKQKSKFPSCHKKKQKQKCPAIAK